MHQPSYPYQGNAVIPDIAVMKDSIHKERNGFPAQELLRSQCMHAQYIIYALISFLIKLMYAAAKPTAAAAIIVMICGTICSMLCPSVR